jgi:kinesin family member C2/C3
VNYRALNDLFNISQERKQVIDYEVGVQMIEVYNEQLRDLLSTDGGQKKYPFHDYALDNLPIICSE